MQPNAQPHMRPKMRIVAISGNFKRPSKTRQLIETAGRRLAERVDQLVAMLPCPARPRASVPEHAH